MKLIIVDFYGVMSKGNYKNTCRYLAKKYRYDFDYLYKIIYHKYFSAAAVGKISEKESFQGPIKELGLKENWKELRTIHLSFQILNKSVFKYILNLQKQGYIIQLLSKNTPYQFKYTINKLEMKKYFKYIINTYNLKLPKASKKTIQYVLKLHQIKPSETIMIDDQDFNLVEPSKLGVKIILYNNFQQMKSELKNYLK